MIRRIKSDQVIDLPMPPVIVLPTQDSTQQEMRLHIIKSNPFKRAVNPGSDPRLDQVARLRTRTSKKSEG